MTETKGQRNNVLKVPIADTFHPYTDNLIGAQQEVSQAGHATPENFATCGKEGEEIMNCHLRKPIPGTNYSSCSHIKLSVCGRYSPSQFF
jgi:hypothetical protein